jgi:hypothetical protein
MSSSSVINLKPNIKMELMRGATTYFPQSDKMPNDEALFWYEEETIEEGVEENEFTEITYESDCPTEDDVLLEIMPPGPPLTDENDLDEVKEHKLLEALKKKRNGMLQLPKEAVTSQSVPPPRRKKASISSQIHKPNKSLKHCHSPTFVGENVENANVTCCHPRQRTFGSAQQCSENESNVYNQLAVSNRLTKIDSILQRQSRRRMIPSQSGDRKQQTISLQKFWKEQIDEEMKNLESGLLTLLEDMSRTEQLLSKR